MAFGFYSAITIDHTKCGASDSSNFTVLVNTTDTRFKTVGNGGHVQNSSGFDIRPYLTDGTTALSFEIERYNASTGEVVMWVKLSTVSHTSDTVFRLYYGDSGISTDGSSTAAWDSSFLGVYHLKDGTTLSVASSTGSNNGTNHGCTATAGQIDGGAALASASSQYVDCSTGMNPTAVTYSCWLNMTSHTTDYNTVINLGLSSDNAGFYVKSNGKLYMLVTASTTLSYDGTGSHTLSNSTWYHVALTYNSSAGLVGYVNAASDNTVAANGALNTTLSATNIGRQELTNSRFFNGIIDEVHVANVARSADWITTEYNNQLSPSTFYSVGTEQTIASATGSGFFALM